jgi:DNA-binding CsgD family transcriptional regulator
MTLVQLAFALAECAERADAQDALAELSVAVETLDDNTRAVCMQQAGIALLVSGAGFVRITEWLTEALAVARRAGRPNAVRAVSAQLAMLHFVVGEWEIAEALVQTIDDLAGSPSAVANVQTGREFSAFRRGRFDEMRQLLENAVPTNPRMVASLELARLQLDLALGGDSGTAARLETRIAEARRRGFSSAVGMLGWGPGTLRMAYVDAEAGAREVVAWYEESPSPWATFVLPAYMTLGHLDGARAKIEADREEPWGPESEAMSTSFETALLRLEGDFAAAEQCGHEALREHHRINGRPQFVHTLETLSGIAAVLGSPVESARLMGAAQAMRDEMGYVLRWPFEVELQAADGAAARAAIGDDAYDAAFAEGRTLDEDAVLAYVQRARGERKRPTAGWESLTPTELDVVRLAASGLTNKQIGAELLMGAETVKTHLSHVYDKVGVRSRAAIAAEYTVRGGT